MRASEGVLSGQSIAYFSMEIGLLSEIPTYSGGLGVLAGDTIRSAADLNIPLVGVSLLSNRGYFRQTLDSQGGQTEHGVLWEPSKFMSPLPEEVKVKLGAREVKLRAWLYPCKSHTGSSVPVIFLDTNLEENHEEDRGICDYLYGGDESYRFKQELVLGIGGVRMLEALGFSIRKYHMNEGHSSLLALELLRQNGTNISEVRKRCIFTTHTPVEAGHDKFDYKLVESLIPEREDLKILKKLGGEEKLNMSLFALNLSAYINGVTKQHSRISQQLFPGYQIQAITNGVHSYTWTSPFFRELYDRYLPGWANEPELLVRADGIPDDEIWAAHRNAKKALIDYVNQGTGAGMDYETLTLGFARRMTEYKRPAFIFSELERLRKINEKGKLQLIFAGKAHPKDEAGKQLIREIFGYMEELKAEMKIVFLENYDMELASRMVAGVDLWLNTPQRPFEASGTSGMKAAHNGVINFSVLDGWWIEGWIEGVNGWAIGSEPDEPLSEEECRACEINDLYNKLYYIIVPTYYKRRDEWFKLMNNSISMIAYYFNSHRMMRRYVTQAYL
ncbi:MAG: alpha-glucan family phosphorylase [Methanosarcinaceae archaeon]|nr:alpha-glucan family phosphorylase [Methanosarcinaceae archaeon]